MRKRGTHPYVRTCSCTPSMTCVIYIATWSLNAKFCRNRQSAESLLRHSIVANFDTAHAACATTRQVRTGCAQGSWNGPISATTAWKSNAQSQRYKSLISLYGPGRDSEISVKPRNNSLRSLTIRLLEHEVLHRPNSRFPVMALLANASAAFNTVRRTGTPDIPPIPESASCWHVNA